MSIAGIKAARYRPGDWVTFPIGRRQAVARIVEDRGPLGVDRRRLYRIRLMGQDPDPFEFEMAEAEMEPLAGAGAVSDYLAGGGLLAILRRNPSGGRDQPRAWLAFRETEGLTYTTDPAFGMVGGSTIPFMALQDDKIFVAKADEVAEFLQSLGLGRSEAEAVIKRVGTTP